MCVCPVGSIFCRLSRFSLCLWHLCSPRRSLFVTFSRHTAVFDLHCSQAPLGLWSSRQQSSSIEPHTSETRSSASGNYNTLCWTPSLLRKKRYLPKSTTPEFNDRPFRLKHATHTRAPLLPPHPPIKTIRPPWRPNMSTSTSPSATQAASPTSSSRPSSSYFSS